jgi:PHD/YefM family antitoxin component YafN of YafNO toxin-antitoxin module
MTAEEMDARLEVSNERMRQQIAEAEKRHEKVAILPPSAYRRMQMKRRRHY